MPIVNRIAALTDEIAMIFTSIRSFCTRCTARPQSSPTV